MLKFCNKLHLRMILEFLFVAAILSVAGYLAYNKVDDMLIGSLEESVAKQSRTIAFRLERQFKQQINELRINAEYIEQGRFNASDLIEMLTSEMPGKTMGILTRNGTVIEGNSLSANTLEVMQRVFDGEKVIRYRNNVGLIFAVPITVDGQTCMLYECYTDKAFRRQFEALSYNGAGTVILLNTREDWTIIADGTKLINTHPDMQPGWEKLGRKLWRQKDETWSPKGDLITDAAATFYEFHDEGYFIYFSKVTDEYAVDGELGFAISGYAPWEAVAVGIDYIYFVMLVTFFIVILLLLVAVQYLMKSRKAKYLEKEKNLANSANQAKSAFLSNMSHEIRTPINAILGMDEMILRESKEPPTLEYAQNLQNAAKSLLSLINDILDFSKIEAGKMEIIPVEYHLSSVLNDLVNMIQKRAEDKGLKFIVDADKNLPSVLFGDEVRIKQIVTNILTNAVKYTKTGSVTLKVAYKNIDDENIYLCVSVADTGIGIKEEDIKKLFSAFERIEEERNRNIEGTGLGMNITKQLLAMMNSKLEVASVYGQGSTFSFQIEQRIVNPEPIGDFEEAYRKSFASHKEYHESFTAPDAHILVVDDTVMNLTVVKGLLKQTKIKIDTAECGRKCLDLVVKKKYDIIFLDHRMPGMDGIETLQAMEDLPNNLNKDTPVISLTANAISGAREQYIAAGFQDYLTKPINSQQLESLIIKYLPPEKVHSADESKTETPIEDTNLPEWLTKIDGLDLNAGIEHCGGVEPYLDVLNVFANSISTAAEDIEGFFKAEDWKNYTTKVHALKSTAKVVGAAELSEKARRLEDAGNSGYINEIQKDTQPLLELYKSYAEKLKPLIKTDDDSDKPLIDKTELAEAYETMKEIAASFDYDSMVFVMQSLDEYKLPDDEAKRYKQIKEAAAKLDWERISELLKTAA